MNSRVHGYINCDLCGGNNTRLISNQTRYQTHCQIVKCKRCGLVYMNPRPDNRELSRYYLQDYHQIYSKASPEAEKLGFGVKKDFQEEKQRVLLAKRRAYYLNPYLKSSKLKKVLDIGCGTGHFLSLMKKRGYETYGLEPDGRLAAQAKEIFGIDVLNKRLEEIDFKEQKFEIITLFHTLEHFPSPSNSLLKINELLAEGGLIFLELPNVNDFRLKAGRKKDFSAWFYQPAHLFYFSSQTLKEMLKKTGFKVIKIISKKESFPLSFGKILSGSPIAKGKMYNDLKRVFRKPYDKILGFLNKPLNYFIEKFGMGEFIMAIAKKE